MSQESEIQRQIDRLWRKIEELRELVGHQGDLLVRTMAISWIMCFRCGRAMSGTIDASRSFLSFKCEKCGANENYVIPGDMTEKRDKAEPELAWDSVMRMYPDEHPPTCGSCRWYMGPNHVMPQDLVGYGNCLAHPVIVAKHDTETCGEHSPR